jgi:hypothetical protein
MGGLSQYYPHIIGVLVVCLIYAWARRASKDYAEKIKRELEKHVQVLPPASSPPAPPLIVSSDSASIADAKQRILQKIHAGPKDLGQQLDLVVHDLATALVELEFIRLHASLYRSQIRMMRAINVHQSQAMSRQEAEAAYQKLVAADSAVSGAPFKDWVGFLVSKQLLNVGVDSFALTVRGQDFLVWLVRNGIAEKENEFR